MSVLFDLPGLPNSISVEKKPPKQMLSISQHDGVTTVKINYSSLDLIQTCKRKAYYALERKLKGKSESDALSFGTGIHKGLEAWYLTLRKSRTNCRTNGSHCSDSQGFLCSRCLAVQAFSASTTGLANLDIGDKRHPYNGERILDEYFRKYADDPFEVYCDKDGPVVERGFEFPLTTFVHAFTGQKVKIIYFGTVDCVLKNTETNTILICDHKTTSSLGTEFYQRIKPNFQYTGYVMGAQKALGINTDLFLVNGLQVAKTKVDLARQVTQRTAEDFQELTQAVQLAVSDYLDAQEVGSWPQSTPNPCSMYGGCQYRSICEVPQSLKENVINSMFNNGDKTT